MFAKLVFWLIGSRDLKIESAHAGIAIDILSESGANVRKLKAHDDYLTFSLPLYDCEPISRILSRHNIRLEIVREHGLFYLIKRYRHRYGIPLGIGMFAAILFLSEQFIWTIDVVGNSQIPSAVLIERLGELGYGVGSYIPGIDFNTLHNQYLIEYDDIAWMALNVHGTAATLEVRETIKNEPIPDEGKPHNLIASEDGIISHMEIYKGSAVARQDELVRRGELLASGIMELKHSLELVHARGRVLAHVKRNFHIEVPLKSTVREPTGYEYCEKYINIFGKSLKLFGKSGKIPSEYDIIESEHQLCFFGEIEVPISIRKIVYREFEQTPVLLDEASAKSQAYARLREEYEKLPADCQLISREITAGMLDGAYVIDCKLVIETDIATEVPIYTDSETEIEK